MTTERKKKFIIDFLYVLVIILIAFFILKYLVVWLAPFFIGFLVSIVLQTPVNFLTEKVKIPRGISSFICVFFILTAIFAILFGVAYGVYSSIPSIVDWITLKAPEVKQTFTSVMSFISGITEDFAPELAHSVEKLPGKVIDAVVPKVTSFLTSFATNLVMDIPSLIIASIITIVASCFITKDYRKIMDFILMQVSDANKKVLRKTKSLFVENILKMLRGYIFIMLITFCELFAGFLIIRLENAWLIAAGIAVFDILPVLGSGGILITWSVISLILGNPIMALEIIVIYAIVTVVRNIIEPKIIGHQVGLPPIITLASMFLGYYLFGGIGLFALPVGIIILVKLQEHGLIKFFKSE